MSWRCCAWPAVLRVLRGCGPIGGLAAVHDPLSQQLTAWPHKRWPWPLTGHALSPASAAPAASPAPASNLNPSPQHPPTHPDPLANLQDLVQGGRGGGR